MKSTLTALFVAVLLLNACNTSETVKEKLWYESPAEDWFSALPLGNGRLGAMVFGTLEEEHIQMNEESLWAGRPENPYPENVQEHYLKFQDLNLKGNFTEALDYAMENLAVTPTSFRSYEPLGDLFVTMGHGNAENYRRELDLETGISKVQYEIDGKKYLRESFISDTYDAMFFHFKSINGDKLEASVRFDREKDIRQLVDENNILSVNGQIFDDEDGYDANIGGSGKGGYHMKFAARIAVKSDDGEVLAEVDVPDAMYLDEDLEFGEYVYCITFVYESGAETCAGEICETVEVTGGAFVDGLVVQAAYLGGAPVEGALVWIYNDDASFEFQKESHF